MTTQPPPRPPGTWLPAGWEHPTYVPVDADHHLRPIRATDVDLDMPAVMGSRERLWSIYGVAWGWPPAHMTHEMDREDLARHEAEIEAHESFNYALFDVDETELLGCVYVDPPRRSVPTPRSRGGSSTGCSGPTPSAPWTASSRAGSRSLAAERPPVRRPRPHVGRLAGPAPTCRRRRRDRHDRPRHPHRPRASAPPAPARGARLHGRGCRDPRDGVRPAPHQPSPPAAHQPAAPSLTERYVMKKLMLAPLALIAFVLGLLAPARPPPRRPAAGTTASPTRTCCGTASPDLRHGRDANTGWWSPTGQVPKVGEPFMIRGYIGYIGTPCADKVATVPEVIAPAGLEFIDEPVRWDIAPAGETPVFQTGGLELLQRGQRRRRHHPRRRQAVHPQEGRGPGVPVPGARHAGDAGLGHAAAGVRPPGRR